MPSPFPGMDPFLEGDLWTTFHAAFAPEIARQLAPKRAPRYVALTEKRYVLDAPEDLEIVIEGRYPDVGIMETPRDRWRSSARTVATAELVAAPLEMATVLPEKVPHYWVEIRDARHRRLVTVIEILSPSNKQGTGRRDYLAKRNKLLRSTSRSPGEARPRPRCRMLRTLTFRTAERLQSWPAQTQSRRRQIVLPINFALDES